MKLSQSLNDAFCQQILVELGNVTKYMQIASYFEDIQLKKLAKFFKDQSMEEKNHADKFMQHINDRVGGKVELGEVLKPSLSLGDPASVGDVFLKIEQDTTESIESLYDLALNERSYVDLPFLTDMLENQVVEEDEAEEFLVRIKNVKDLVLFDATF